MSDDADHQPSRTRVPMPIAALSDPHMGDAARDPDRVEKLIALVFVLSMVFFGLAGAAYWQNWNVWVFGGALGAGLFVLGFGLTAWGKYLMPQGPFVEERHVLASTPEERDAMSAALVERSAVVVKRRKMLGGLFAVGSRHLRDRGGLPADPLPRSAAQGRVRRHPMEGRFCAGRLQRAAGEAGHPRGGRHHDGLPAQHKCASRTAR